MNNMTLTQAMKTLETLLNQQMSDDAEEAIRTVLDGMKQRVEVVRCFECESMMKPVEGGHNYCEDHSGLFENEFYCAHGVRKEKENEDA